MRPNRLRISLYGACLVTFFILESSVRLKISFGGGSTVWTRETIEFSYKNFLSLQVLLYKQYQTHLLFRKFYCLCLLDKIYLFLPIRGFTSDQRRPDILLFTKNKSRTNGYQNKKEISPIYNKNISLFSLLSLKTHQCVIQKTQIVIMSNLQTSLRGHVRPIFYLFIFYFLNYILTRPSFHVFLIVFGLRYSFVFHYSFVSKSPSLVHNFDPKGTFVDCQGTPDLEPRCTSVLCFRSLGCYSL